MERPDIDRSELAAASEPAAVKEALAAKAEQLRSAGHGHHGGGGAASIRTAVHKGHEIVVKTTYEITVDGRPFDAPVVVDNSGRVHYHGLPTRDFTSTISLVKKAIDYFPEDFPAANESPAGGHSHHSGDPRSDEEGR